MALVDEFIKGYYMLNDCNSEVEVIDWVVKHVMDYSEEQVQCNTLLHAHSSQPGSCPCSDQSGQ